MEHNTSSPTTATGAASPADGPKPAGAAKPAEISTNKTSPYRSYSGSVVKSIRNRTQHVNVRDRARALSMVFLVMVAAAAGFGGGWFGSRSQQGGGYPNTAAARQQVILNESQLISSIAKDVGQSVVSITVTSIGVQQGLFGQEQSEESGAGTGFIITNDGIVVTNRHVVPRGTTQVSVTLSDGTKLSDVEVIGRTSDKDTLDIAFLKIKDTKGKKLVPIAIGDSSKVQVGDRVVAIGNALGQFQNTVTSGIISGYGREITAGDRGDYTGESAESLQNLFQTDAAINPGNSGGPLVNVSGEVIGINVAVAGSAQSIGFAIPVDDVKGLIASVEKNGKLERPYLGVRYVQLTDDIAYRYNLDVKRGAYVAPTESGQPSIVSGSPADKAGIKEKDVIIAVNDVKIDEKNSLVSVLGRYGVGETVTIKVNRDGKEQDFKATLEAAPQQ